MLTVLPPAANGRVRLEFEWPVAGLRPIRLRFAFSRRRSTAGIRAGVAEAAARALCRVGEAERADAMRRLNRDFDRAVARGWI